MKSDQPIDEIRECVIASRLDLITIRHAWLPITRGRYEIYISVLVVEEAKAGDAVAAQKAVGRYFWAADSGD